MTTMTLEAPTIFVLTPKAKTSAREKTSYTQKLSKSRGASLQDTSLLATTQESSCKVLANRNHQMNNSFQQFAKARNTPLKCSTNVIIATRTLWHIAFYAIL